MTGTYALETAAPSAAISKPAATAGSITESGAMTATASPATRVSTTANRRALRRRRPPQ